MAASDDPDQRIGPRPSGEESPRDRGKATDMERKTIRFPKATVEHVESLVEAGEYPDFSTAIREELPDEWPGLDREGDHA